MKASLLMVAAVTAAIGFPASAGAFPPPFPLPFIEYDGTYLVGTDIRPGLYLTLGSRGDGTCSWSRRSSTASDDAAGVIERGESRDAQYALIATTDAAFETRGCQTWSMGTRPATPITPNPKTCIYPLTGCVNPNPQQPD